MAENLKALRRRIRSVSNTQQITRAMESVSAAKLRRSQDQLAAARPYAHTLRGLVGQLAGTEYALQQPLFQQRPVKRRLLVVLTSGRGLCGGFNSNVLRLADNWLKEHHNEDPRLACIGKKGRDYYRRRKGNIVFEAVENPGVAVYDDAEAAARFCVDQFLSGEVDAVDLAYTQFLSMVRVEATLQPFLPLRQAELVVDEAEAGEHYEYIYEPDVESVVAALLPQYVRSQMYLVLCESVSAEHSARRMAMHNATQNCDELIGTLTLRRNKARQTAITTELLDIVGGAEALQG